MKTLEMHPLQEVPSLAEGRNAQTYMSATAPTSYVETKAVRYAYRSLGQGGGIPLVCLQHFRGMMDDWDPWVVDALAKGRHVILFDNVGVGLSSGKVPGTVGQMAENAVEFLGALGLEQVDLLAFSLGGFVGQQILLDHPSLIRRAILAGTGPQGGHGMQGYTPEVTAEAVKFPLTGREKEFLFFTSSEAGQKAAAAFVERTQLRVEDRDVPTSMQAMEAQGNAIGLWGRSSKDDYNARLATVSQPILVANGLTDIMVPSINAYELAQSLPNAQLILYPDAGHGAIFQFAELFAAHATMFLS